MRRLPRYLINAGRPPAALLRAFACATCGARLVRTPSGYWACPRSLAHGGLVRPETLRQRIMEAWPLRWRKNVSRLLVCWVWSLLPTDCRKE